MIEQEKTKRELHEDLWVASRGSAQLADENARLRARLHAAEQALERHLSDAGQTQRLEVFGQLVGDVAHEFNNLLMVMTGYSEILLTDAQQSEPNRRLLNEIYRAGAGAAALTQRLFALSRVGTPTRSVVDLNLVVSGLDKTLHRLIGEQATLVTVLAPSLAKTRADLGQLEEIILHLAIHARDAMSTDGTLTLHTQNAGAGVQLDVSAGPNASHDAPTDVSLATVRYLARQNGGSVHVENLPDLGPTLRLRLATLVMNPPAEDTVPHGVETVLLVEDEDCVRSIARQALQMWGYTVLEARCGAEALHICERHAGPIALVLSDVNMPEIPGPQLVTMLQERRPGIKALFLSGYGNEVLQGAGEMLQKPFTPSSLAKKVREVLDR